MTAYSNRIHGLLNIQQTEITFNVEIDVIKHMAMINTFDLKLIDKLLQKM